MGKVIKNIFLSLLIIIFTISLSLTLVIYKVDHNFLEKDILTKNAINAIEKQSGNSILEEVKGLCLQNVKAGANASLQCNNITESEATKVISEIINYGYNELGLESKHQMAKAGFNIFRIIAIISLIIIFLINIKTIKSFFAWIGSGLIASGIIYIVIMTIALGTVKGAINTQIAQITTLLSNIINIPYIKEGIIVIIIGVVCLIIWGISRHYSKPIKIKR